MPLRRIREQQDEPDMDMRKGARVGGKSQPHQEWHLVSGMQRLR